MSNKASLKRSMFLSVIAMLLCVSMFVGTTFAWFTDTVKTGVNTIKSGTLDVELEYWDGTAYKSVESETELFDPNALWEPGHAEVVYLKIRNVGNLALKYNFSINIVGETLGKTQGDNPQDIRLSEHLKYGIIGDVAADAYGLNRANAIAAVQNSYPLTEALKNEHGYASMASADPMLPKTEKTLAVVVWMPTEVGNEANHNGVDVPTIYLGLNLVASQVAKENDSFGTDYDALAKFPLLASATAAVVDGKDVEMDVRATNGSKLGTALIPDGAIADDAETVNVTIEKISVDTKNVTVISDDQEAQSFDVSVTGLKDNNTEKVRIELRVGKNLTGIRLFHKNVEIPSSEFTYSGEYITFESATFSPFTVIYDKEAQEEVLPDIGLPIATVTDSDENENTEITWSEYGGFSPSNPNQQIESAYVFKAPHTADTVDECIYKDWHCDYFVKMDKDVAEGAIFLAGNYGDFGWIGFENPIEVQANVEVPLLGSVIEVPWTYESIVTWVGEFICGVSHLDESLNGATFTVMLRLTNPENPDEYYNVNTVEYTFDTTPAIVVPVTE